MCLSNEITSTTNKPEEILFIWLSFLITILSYNLDWALFRRGNDDDAVGNGKAKRRFYIIH